MSISEQLNRLQSDYQVLYQKLRNYHWNVVGPQFFGLHPQFEAMYTEVAVHIDNIAERTLAIGVKPAVTTLAGQLKLASLKEDETSPEAAIMVANLKSDLENLNRSLRALSKSAGEAGDIATVNLADAIADAQEKTVWMLRAFGE